MSARPPARNWLAVPLAAALALLLLTVLRRPGPAFELPENGPESPGRVQPFRPARELQRHFGPPAGLPWATNLPGTSPFLTAAIRPPAAPVPPPPPQTKKVTMLYQGHMETSRGVRTALVRLADGPGRLFRMGDEVAGGFLAANIAHTSLTLTNAAGQQVELSFRVPLEVEVPLP